MENRSGLLVDVLITDSTLFEPTAAVPMLDRRRQARPRMSTLGADKGYFTKAFVAKLRSRNIAPHIARIDSRSAPGLDRRTRKSRFVGIAKTRLAAYMVGAAYNLLRMSRLQPATG
jgi:hypothetical protein